MHIGTKIKELRKKNKLTQKDLANKINMSEISIRKYESGDRMPSLEVIFKLCGPLNVEPTELLQNNKELLWDFFNGLDEDVQEKMISEHYYTELETISNLFKEFDYEVRKIVDNKIYIIEVIKDEEVLIRMDDTEFVNRGNELLDEIRQLTSLQINQFINRNK
jgi:transcriptional regulator with XRE-family HTH domain